MRASAQLFGWCPAQLVSRWESSRTAFERAALAQRCGQRGYKRLHGQLKAAQMLSQDAQLGPQRLQKWWKMGAQIGKMLMIEVEQVFN